MPKIKKKFVIAVSFIVIFAILLVLLYSFLSVRQVVINYATSYAETISLDIVNKTVADELSARGVNYNDIVRLERNDDNNVSSLEIDTAKINYLKSIISFSVSKALTGSEDYVLSIPLGNILGNEYFLGFGPRLKFKMKMTTTVFTDFESNFYAAGINQVLHQIIIKVKVAGSFVLPWSTSGFKCETTVIAAQTVLVGVTPDAYTNVIENYADEGSGTVGNIFDYGADVK
ncbi:MAG: sporulation protein YunB [Clostridia bacterium]|nr:sporulation protein YunB [Clostridia bacterium]